MLEHKWFYNIGITLLCNKGLTLVHSNPNQLLMQFIITFLIVWNNLLSFSLVHTTKDVMLCAIAGMRYISITNCSSIISGELYSN